MDIEKIKKSVKNKTTYQIKMAAINQDEELEIVSALNTILIELGKEALHERLAYCLRELSVNANRANLKRAFFLENKLNIEKKEDYQKGMQNFKKEMIDNLDFYQNKLSDLGFYVYIKFEFEKDVLLIKIENNVPITDIELERIRNKIDNARAFSSLEDAFSSALDDSEGAGLGLIILLLTLRNLGLNKEAFNIEAVNGITIAQIAVPLYLITDDQSEVISDIIKKELEQIPQLPDNVIKIQQLIDNPKSNLEDIAHEIKKDSSFVADLIKIVNSAYYMLPRKVNSILEAIKIIGLKGLRNLLYSYGTEYILSDKYKKSQLHKILEHSYKVAYYSFQIARSKKMTRQIDDIYTAAILHDIGKIIVTGLHEDTIDNIINVCKEKHIPQRIIEDLSFGTNHAKIGAMLAEKWNFPEEFIKTIEFHHQPILVNDDNLSLVYTVHLANAIANFQEGMVEFETIEPKVLKVFSIHDKEQFIAWSRTLEENYKQKNKTIQ